MLIWKSGVAILHVANKGDLRLGEIIKSFRDGMKELAKQVKEDERIKRNSSGFLDSRIKSGTFRKSWFYHKRSY